MADAPWSHSFEVEDEPDGTIALRQIGYKDFELGSTIRYIGAETGLEDKLSDTALEEIRCVSPERLPTTDLASVPGILRWFAGRYGIYTPAALIHDWLIPQPSIPPVEGMKDEYADRYFRFMLEDLGVQLIRRWLMWAATAARTRWHRSFLHKVLLTIWVFASVSGMAAFVIGVVNRDWVTVVVAAFAPLVFAILWGRQYGAGIVAAYSAPWILPPTLFAAAGYLVYLALEWAISKLSFSR